LNALIEISQGFKTFWVYLKALIRKTISNFLYFLKNFLEKTKCQNLIFFLSLFKPMQACLQRNESQKCFIRLPFKTLFDYEFQNDIL
jgi:hypothetical protein